MRVEEIVHHNVGPDGKIEEGGSVETVPIVRMGFGEGCGLPSCHCSDGYWIMIGTRRTRHGMVRGLLVKFDGKAEFDEFMRTHAIKGK